MLEKRIIEHRSNFPRTSTVFDSRNMGRPRETIGSRRLRRTSMELSDGKDKIHVHSRRDFVKPGSTQVFDREDQSDPMAWAFEPDKPLDFRI